MLPFLKKILGSDTSSETGTPEELSHINQEMYKKSAELSERNKTLLLLRKIDEIILSSITNQNEIAQHVTALLVAEGDFQVVSIFIYDKKQNLLKRLARSEAGLENNKEAKEENVSISLLKTENLMVQAVNERNVKIVKSVENVFLEPVHDPTVIKCANINPLVVRNELIGVMVIGLRDEEYDLSEYTKDLLERLAQVIGIAIDNALLYNQLQNANEKLKALDKLKDEFVSLASHELRTPMTAIKSYLWMTLQGEAGALNDKQKLYLERAYSSVDRLIKLVNDMLNISRIESGRLTIEMQNVDLYKLAHEVIDEVHPRAVELGVNVVIPSASTLSPVLADPDKIKEVLFNLIGNSLKFTPTGGNITISFSQNGNMVETKISDTGAGISKENISKLFQKFNMLPDSYAVNQNASGTGLGLYICRSIIELHKGAIWVNSAGLGKGSEFTFSLKVFNENELAEFKVSPGEEIKESVGIVHTQL